MEDLIQSPITGLRYVLRFNKHPLLAAKHAPNYPPLSAPMIALRWVRPCTWPLTCQEVGTVRSRRPYRQSVAVSGWSVLEARVSSDANDYSPDLPGLSLSLSLSLLLYLSLP